MKRLIFFFFSFVCFIGISYPQIESYYNTINPNSLNFISDLKNRIRLPYTQISYSSFDETNIANFASNDNGNGTRSVFCVYSNYEYIYNPPFAWSTLSREHTYCFSWQPGNSGSRPEYSDQHHLFPTHQNNANGRRSNHPLGIVVNPTYTFLESKLGTNTSGQVVYEPRNAHKGDAARALLYMAVRYDGVDGYNWTFNWLNNTKLPSLSEAPQDLATLIAWHKQDPPDKWEVDRNNYIQSIQQNRNPFVDHPEYVNYINFNDLNKLSPVYSNEPQYYASNFSAAPNSSSITLNWTDALPGIQSPSGYLIIAYKRDNYFMPIDGEVYSDDGDLSDGVAVINVPYSNPDSYNFSNLSNGTYYFTLYSYNGSGSSINYKIDGTLTRTSATVNTTLAAEPTNHVTNFLPGLVTSSSIELTWTDALIETQLPEGYLILANTTGTFTSPNDGTVYVDDTNLADGSGLVNVSYLSANSYSFAGLNSSTPYYFRIFSYNGSGGTRNYKTDGTIPQTTATTSTISLAIEPTNHVTNFTQGAVASSSIEVTWTDALAGTQIPEGYLLLANTSGIFSNPGDGIAYSNDTTLADGNAAVNISYAGANSYNFNSLNSNTTYYFKIFSYNGSGSQRNYKTDGTVPQTTASTTGSISSLPNAWINEFHYDNSGTDVNEFIEVVLPNTYTSATELAKFSIVLYNGNGGTSYSTKTLDLFTKGNVDTINGFTYYYFMYPQDGIQNGSPDGIALGYNNSLIQFLSYEGTFTATGGIANGVLSTDVGVSENGSANGTSLGLTGAGKKYSDFTWTVFSNSASSGSANVGQSYLPRTLQVTALMEGLFNGTTMISDTVTLELRNTSSPYSLIESQKIIINSNGIGTGSFIKPIDGTQFYIVLKHRNSIETWSSSQKSFSYGSLSYDFTTNSNKAFGSNLKLINGKWCIFSGDVNQDGVVNASDLGSITNEAYNYSVGYKPTDLNGDNFIDLNDLVMCETNAINFVGKITP